MIREAIILAGGLGTRLRSAVPDLPKCMAPVAGIPFLEYVLQYLKGQSIESFIFSVGYKYEVIEQYLSDKHEGLNYRLSIEENPLGTGGGIRLACSLSTEKNVIIVNGDTLFRASLSTLAEFHQQHSAACTLALKPMKRFDRYGTVEITRDGYIQSFSEKKYHEQGLINGGVYALQVAPFLKLEFEPVFSFEKDYMEKYFSSQKMMGIVQDEYFIDIGIPEDYERAKNELHRSSEL